MSEMEEIKSGFTWEHLVVTALATGAVALLAIYTVIWAQVAPFPGVLGLYLAAGIYVPLSLWLGIWGCIVGYFSCVIFGILVVPFVPHVVFIWSLADFIKGLIPLIAFRLFKADVDIGADLKRKNELYILLGVLVVNLILAAIATAIPGLEILWLITLIVAIVLIFGMYLLNPSKSWLLYIVFGIFGAAIGPALIKNAVQIAFGIISWDAFGVGVIGLFASDLIITSAITTLMMVYLTGKMKETPIFVENWFS